MASILAVISEAAFGKLRTREGRTPAVGTQIELDRYESSDPTLDALKLGGALYLVAVQPDETVWLAAVLCVPARTNDGWQSPPNLTPVVDLTPLCSELGLERGEGKLAMRLQTPRVLDQRVEAILTHVERESLLAFKRSEPYVLDVPRSILQLPAVPAARPAPKPKPVQGGKLPPLAGVLGEPCLAQLDTVLDELRKDPVAFLTRKANAKPPGAGPFTQAVPSVFAGTVDAAEAKRMLDKEFHPWVDDAIRASMTNATGDLDEDFGKLVDIVAIRAIDDLCTGMVGYAIDRVDLIPDACKWYFDPLQHYAKHAKALLRPAKTAGTAVKAAKKPPKSKASLKSSKALAKGTFAFVNCRTLDGDAVVAETAVHQAQFVEAMAMYAGLREDTAEATLDAHMKAEGMFARSDFHIELWDVLEGGHAKPRFEYWVQGAGDGTIFNYGTDESPGSIGSTQHSFEAHGADDDDTKRLVEALQAAADRTSGL